MEILYADETLDSTPSSQEGGSFLNTESMDSSNSNPMFSINLFGKRKRSEDTNENCERSRSEKRRVSCEKAEKHPQVKKESKKSIKHEPQKTTESCMDKRQFLHIQNIKVPESASLFSTVSLSWNLQVSFKDVNLSDLCFAQALENLPKKSAKNGIWLKIEKVTNTQKNPLEKEIFLLIELYERHLQKQSTPDESVQFCNGKCGIKKKHVIELQEKRILLNESGLSECFIAINEQCAHRSANDYGSPSTRFYFKLSFFERSGVTLVNFLNSESSLVKVVAPGKNKPAVKTPAFKKVVPKAAKLSMKQMMESFLHTIKTFDERLSRIEEHFQKQTSQQYQLQMMEGTLASPKRDIKSDFFSGSDSQSDSISNHYELLKKDSLGDEGMQFIEDLMKFEALEGSFPNSLFQNQETH